MVHFAAHASELNVSNKNISEQRKPKDKMEIIFHKLIEDYHLYILCISIIMVSACWLVWKSKKPKQTQWWLLTYCIIISTLILLSPLFWILTEIQTILLGYYASLLSISIIILITLINIFKILKKRKKYNNKVETICYSFSCMFYSIASFFTYMSLIPTV